MKILFFGRGVIATQYAWAFEKAGHQVEFYVRPGRIAEYGPSVKVDILDGRKSLKGIPVQETWQITMHEEINPAHDYDLIIVSVNHSQLDSVVNILKPVVGNATVLMWNNLWQDPQETASALPQNQLIWGFPGGGGGFMGNTLKGGFMKTVFMEATGNDPARHRAVYSLFKNAGFTVSAKKDFPSWLWVHFIINAGMAAVALKVGGYKKMYGSPSHLKEALLLMGEMLRLLKAKGGKPSFGENILFALPAGLTGFAMHKLMSGKNIASLIMDYADESGHLTYELTKDFPCDILADAKKLGVSLPRLEAMAEFF